MRTVTIENFKSFRHAELPLAPLTLLIGANASGKSNAIEALQLLHWLAGGQRLGQFLSAVRDGDVHIRGGVADLTYRGAGGDIGLGCTLEAVGEDPALALTIRLSAEGGTLRVRFEELDAPDLKTEVPLYRVEQPARPDGSEMEVAYNNFARGHQKPRIACIDQQAVFTQLITPARFGAKHAKAQAIIPAAAARVRATLEDILFLDPIPARMRDYRFVDERQLRGDGANLSSVLYHLCTERGEGAKVLEFVQSLPEQDVIAVDFVATPRNEVMLKLTESFGGVSRDYDAPLLSDGTLRVLAIAAALLSVDPGSFVVIEEIDNGVHPTRAELLLSNIRGVAEARDLRVLLTTHNPALLDALPLGAVPDVVVAYRDLAEGDSRLVRLETLADYPELMAQGPLGRLVTQGTLDRYLKHRPLPAQRLANFARWLEAAEAAMGA